MTKLIRLSPTGIEYGDYAWNFASGCGNNIDGRCKSGGFKCWAYSITQRFEGHYPNGFKPTIYPEALFSPLYLKKPSRILCAFMGDLFWDCPVFNPERVLTPSLPNPIPSACFTLHGTLRQIIFGVARACPQHTFIFLTKQPQNLIKFSPFPPNCWVGVTATNAKMLREALMYLEEIRASVKYVSLEPLLGQIYDPLYFLNALPDFLSVIDWVIIGAQTKPYKPPKIEWVEEIVRACDKAGVKVFLKDNLLGMDLPYNDMFFPYECAGSRRLRQEVPK